MSRSDLIQSRQFWDKYVFMVGKTYKIANTKLWEKDQNLGMRESVQMLWRNSNAVKESINEIEKIKGKKEKQFRI